MHIGLDAHTLGSKVGGNETYIRNLVTALGELDGQNRYSVYLTNPASANGLVKNFKNFELKTLKPKNPLIRIPFSTPLRMIQDQTDLFLMQYVAPPVSPKPYVLVIHDISYEHYPRYFKKLELLRLRATTPFSARNAAHIITCSEYTKKDLVRFYKINPDKISVTYYGKSEIFVPIKDKIALEATQQKYGIDSPYILYVGNIQPRKNLPRLLEAFKLLKKEKKIPQKLVITGNKAWLYSDVFRFIRQEGLESEIVLTGYVPDADLPSLYSGAILAVYPSIFEGFGFPVLEAMACGTPVVTSNTSSLPEVAGDAAFLVDPLSTEALFIAIFELLTKPEKRQELTEKGFKQAARFDWKKTARETLDIFEKVSPNLGAKK